MKRTRIVSCAALLACFWIGTGARAAHAGEQDLNGQHFTLPDGLVIELVAGPPLVDRPISADFDDAGHLYVSDSSGTNDNVQKQLAEKPHRILRLDDTDGDGRFDHRTVFADHMMFPEGVMCFGGSVYVAAAPSIWKLTDLDGDGVADRREEWFQGKTLTGCANDLHGPYFGPDGWIYWCKGAFAEQRYERPGKPPWVTRAAHIFRCRLDGSGIEPVMTGGMDNPVEVVFTLGGERIFTTTFLQYPAGGLRDGLIHAIYGGVYGKVHDVLNGHPQTGEVMPVLTHLGPAAPCGLVRLESDQLGPGYRNNLLACLFNMHKLTRHVLTPQGASFATTDEDFLVSTNVDFHPTDVLEDADGSLLVVDTGGWYKLCCPTSHLWKPDVLGAIYRVRRADAAAVEDPRGLKLAWSTFDAAQLAALLDDARPAVRRRAVAALARAGSAAIQPLARLRAAATSAVTRAYAVWALTRVDDPDARAAVRAALDDPAAVVRQAALQSISLWRDRAAAPAAIRALAWPDLANRRAAAEALGRIGDPAAINSLLHSADAAAGRVLEHALAYALIELDDPTATAAGLASPNVATQRIAMIALDQMPGGGLEPARVAALLGSSEQPLRETAAWIVSHHPEWGGALVESLRERLQAEVLTGIEQTELESQLTQFAAHPAVQSLLADTLHSERLDTARVQLALRAIAHCGLKRLPAVWAAELAGLLAHPDAQRVAAAVSAVRQVPAARAQWPLLQGPLMHVARESQLPADVRLEALVALPSGTVELDDSLYDLVSAQVVSSESVRARSLAADLCAQARFTPGQLERLTATLRAAGPMEIDRVLAAFAQAPTDELGHQVVQALAESKGLSGLNPDSIKNRLLKFSPAIQHEAESIYAKLVADWADQQRQLETLLGSLGEGDARRGQQVFYGTKAACSSCHAIGYLGGRIGPDLTHVAKIRTRRDLLESIVLPSMSFVRSYEPMALVTTSGIVHSGIVKKDSPDEIILTIAADKEVRIPRGEIEEIMPGRVSIMPTGLDKQLTHQELADLVSFLMTAN